MQQTNTFKKPFKRFNNQRPQSGGFRSGGFNRNRSSSSSNTSGTAISNGHGTGYTPFNRNKPSWRGSRSKFSSNNNYQNRRGNRSSNFGRDTSIFIKKAMVSETLANDIVTKSFKEFGLSEQLQRNISNKGFVFTTPIQDQAINPILEGKDLIGLANTGTGKTAAFLIPLIEQVINNPKKRVLIIAPTRELACQIREELKEFSQGLRVYSTLVIGGSNLYRQVSQLRSNPQFVIGTPGRLKDLIEHNNLNLNEFNCFVLDEVDLMVDIGFLRDVQFFISKLPPQRQSLFFSATISSKVKGVLDNFVKNPVIIEVKKQDTSENVEQDIVKVIDKSKKIDQLHDLLITEGFDKVLVFGKTKHGVEKLTQQLEFRGFKVGAIHGNKKQGQRQRTLDNFKNNQIKVLLATDVASRGLDIDNVTHVINYELPESYEDYIHRIGRTGRAGKKGLALTFID